MATEHTIEGLSLEKYKSHIAGKILTPQDDDYETVRRGWNRTYNHYPALIVIAHNAQDVVESVRLARELDLGIAVQTTGHGLHMPADDALLIVTSQMTGVKIDADARIAVAEGGAVWQHVLDATTPHGLAPLLGSSPHVGVVGYSLGGGIGWLGRKYGYAADSVQWVDIVTADGELRRASLTENSDLFWGLRGGNGNFGVVTAIGFNLYPVATIYGGHLRYPVEMMGDVLYFFRDWVKTVPDELTSSLALLKIPNLPQIPEAMRGQMLVFVRAAYTGDPAEDERWMQAWLDWQTPLENTFREMPFADIATISNDGVDPVPVWGSNELFAELSDAAIEIILQYTSNPESPMNHTELRHAGGAIGHVPVGGNALGNRDAQFFLNVGGVVPTSEELDALKSYVAEYQTTLRPHRHGGGYLNFMASSDAQKRLNEAYSPEIYTRLLALKSTYDPDNLFRYSYQLTKQ